MAKQKKELTTKKKIKKKIRKALRLKNIGNILIIVASVALLVTSILPYLL